LSFGALRVSESLCYFSSRVLVRYGGKVQAQVVVSQSSYYSCNDSRLHFGLGRFNSVDIDVYWPNGSRETDKHIAADQLVTLREGMGRVANKGWAKS
jgi:enediyne biosynthesis protein E4